MEVPTYYIELRQAIYQAAMELGFEIVDANAEKQLGNECKKIGESFLVEHVL